MPPKITHKLDLTGLKCPLPVLQTGKKLRQLNASDILEVISTDPMSSIDLPHYCNQHHHILLQIEQLDNTHFRYVIQKAQKD
ncbi:MAG: sulfurtransferase TusA family protein [Cohaesibacter sp.]|nr:sulfurtransferase TusA family protein [Cohaesibacter sp.]